MGGMGGRYVSSAQFSSVQFSSVQFSSVQFSSLQFRLGQVSSVQILHARMHACTGSRQPCAVECRMAARQRALLAAAAACCSRFARDGEPFRQALSRCRQRAAASAAARRPMRTKAALQSCGRTASANGICSLNRQLRRAGAPASIETSFVAKQQPTIAAAAGIQQHESIAPCRGLCAPCAALADVRRRCRIDAGNVRL